MKPLYHLKHLIYLYVKCMFVGAFSLISTVQNHMVLYGIIDQILVNSFHGLFNCEISRLDRRVIYNRV